MRTLIDRLNISHGADTLAKLCREVGQPLYRDRDLDPIMDQIGDSRFVLMGEASHGTSEYYAWRHRLSERLIREKGFSFIGVEGDWPDCYRVNRYIKGYKNAGSNAFDVLHAFERWPTWMWANREVVNLVESLRSYNGSLPEGGPKRKVGFYGLDVYSLWDSAQSVIAFLDRVDPEAAEHARRSYGCFEPYGGEGQEYAWATLTVPTSCEDEAVAMLSELRSSVHLYDGDGDESAFSAEQNALVVRNAESYYRAMVRGGPESWNVRDRHMVETLDRLMDHHGPDAKAIIWEHNTHVGDARATDMARDGMVNVGQLVRESHRTAGVYIVGFGSYRGTVIAGASWGAPMERMPVPPAREGSWEEILHRAGHENRLVLLDAMCGEESAREMRGHRAIGVVYHPERERFGNYVPTILPDRYNAFLFLDETRALRPLHIKDHPDAEPPDTYPWSM